MSSRQEEKERRRAERQQREQAEANKASNRRRLQLVAAAVLGIAVVAAVIVAIVSSLGGGGGNKSKADTGTNIAAVPIPAQKISDLDAAAKAAGCTWKQFRDEGHTHIPDTQTFNGYKTNPPTSGTHRITPAQDGVYDFGTAPDVNNAVHAMEHGRVEIQYKKGTTRRQYGQLLSLFNEKVKGIPGFHELLFQNETNMPYAVAATAWSRSIVCPKFNDKVFDAIRAFRTRWIDHGREMVP